MQNQQQNQHISFVLKDGHSRLAAWILPVDQRPGLYETVEVPNRLRQNLMGYEPWAVVTRIEVGKSPPDQIDLEAICLTKKENRPEIILNSHRIGDHRRGDIEAYLRSQLAYPLIYWESSCASEAVVRFHDPVTGLKACPPEIQSGIIEQMYKASDLMAA